MIRWLRALVRRTWMCARCGAAVARGRHLCSLCGTVLEFDMEVQRWNALQAGDEIVVKVLVP